MQNQSINSRIWELDFFRGIALILMIYFHIVFDLKEFFGYPVEYTSFVNASIGRAAAILFIFISGISCSLSRSNTKRGLKLLAVSLAVSLFSYLFNPDFVVKFGILHFLAVGMLLSPFMQKLRPSILLAVGTIIIIAGRYTSRLNVTFDFLFPFGVYSSNFTSSDYYSLIPWLGLFLYGIAAAKILYRERKSLLPFAIKDNFISTAGRHTLVIYLVHQPVIVAVITFLQTYIIKPQ